jgi:uncharacterized metal-binding protein YceD (DUF177 family)
VTCAAEPKETAVTFPPQTEPRPKAPLSQPFRTGALSPRKPTRFALQPDAATRAAIAAELGLLAVHALSFEGEITPTRKQDFVLTARLTARVDQACIVTLAPVAARIEETVERHYLHDFALPTGDEIEMPEDDRTEPLPDVIDVGEVALESLALALPIYPRSPGAELGEVSFPPPDASPLPDDEVKPFASLAALRDKLSGKGE